MPLFGRRFVGPSFTCKHCFTGHVLTWRLELSPQQLFSLTRLFCACVHDLRRLSDAIVFTPLRRQHTAVSHAPTTTIPPPLPSPLQLGRPWSLRYCSSSTYSLR